MYSRYVLTRDMYSRYGKYVFKVCIDEGQAHVFKVCIDEGQAHACASRGAILQCHSCVQGVAWSQPCSLAGRALAIVRLSQL